jgi:hypothetical protein
MKLVETLSDDVAAAQLEQVQFEDAAKSRLSLREAAMDALPRDLNYYLPDGWRHGARNDFETSRAFAVWATRIDLIAPTLKQRVDDTWAALEILQPPVGWKPTGPTDPIIAAAFAKGWPASAVCQVKRLHHGMVCPNCTAVLLPPSAQTSEIRCLHCGEQIELV